MLRRTVLGLLAAGTTVGPAWAQDDWAKTVDAAKKEGKLVIYTASILLAMIEAATPALRRAYLAWLVVVCASTVLTHRHHLLDVASGLALAFATPALLRRPARSGLLLASAPSGRLQE